MLVVQGTFAIVRQYASYKNSVSTSVGMQAKYLINVWAIHAFLLYRFIMHSWFDVYISCEEIELQCNEIAAHAKNTLVDIMMMYKRRWGQESNSEREGERERERERERKLDAVGNDFESGITYKDQDWDGMKLNC